MHRTQPNRQPSTSNTQGSRPGVCQSVISVWERNRLSYRVATSPRSEMT